MINSWTSSCNRKVHQRKINKMIRQTNKQLENDNLWKGRFYCHQIHSPHWEIYEDKSGGIMFVNIEFCDKKTQKRWIQGFDTNDICRWGGWKLWCAMNDFIVKHVKVWDEDPRPSIENTPDWINKTVDMKWEIWGEEI